MADTVTLPGTGAVVATEDEGGVHYQVVKLAASGTGTTASLSRAEDSAHTDGDHGFLMLGIRNHSGAGADGDYAGISVNSSGEMRTVAHRELTRIAVDSGGLTTSVTAYTAGDQVGTQFSLTNAARASGGSGTIVAVQLISAADIIGAYDVVFTRSSITLAADNAAYGISDTDAKAIVGLVQLAGSFDIGNNRIAQAYNLAVPYDCSGGTTLYASLITRAGHTFFAAATDLQLCVWVERN